MSIAVVARGRIVDGPEQIGSDRGPLVSFMLGDAQFGIYRGNTIPLDDLPVVEVNCRDLLAAVVLEQLEVGQYAVVVGTAHISRPLEGAEHGQGLVLLAIEADTVGVDLARPPEE